MVIKNFVKICGHGHQFVVIWWQYVVWFPVKIYDCIFRVNIHIIKLPNYDSITLAMPLTSIWNICTATNATNLKSIDIYQTGITFDIIFPINIIITIIQDYWNIDR